MRTLAKTKRDDVPFFLTLTYPDDFPELSNKWKRDLDAFGKRFRRRYAGGAFLWRLVVVSRKSGENAGKYAPHFHLLVWADEVVQDLTQAQAVVLLRWLRKYIGLGGFSNRSLTGFTVADEWLKAVEYARSYY